MPVHVRGVCRDTCEPPQQRLMHRETTNCGRPSISQLKNAISELLDQPGAQRPERIKFFRGQMQTIITRAVSDLDIKPVPSRRCFTLLSEPFCKPLRAYLAGRGLTWILMLMPRSCIGACAFGIGRCYWQTSQPPNASSRAFPCPKIAGWLRERAETVYQQLEGFNATIRSPLAGEPGPPQELPDTLRGEAWQFVQLPLADLQSELQLAVQVSLRQGRPESVLTGNVSAEFLHVLLAVAQVRTQLCASCQHAMMG